MTSGCACTPGQRAAATAVVAALNAHQGRPWAVLIIRPAYADRLLKPAIRKSCLSCTRTTGEALYNTPQQSPGLLGLSKQGSHHRTGVLKGRLGIWPRCSMQGSPDSFAEGSQRQLPILCSRHCMHAYAAQDADAISLILKDVAFISHNDLHQ